MDEKGGLGFVLLSNKTRKMSFIHERDEEFSSV